MADKRIIFLDIDGPMIPTSMYLVDRSCSFNRNFPATTIAVLNEICKRTGCKIVFNTTHNTPFAHKPDIEVAIVGAGLLSEYLYTPALKTLYPAVARDLSIKDWLARNGPVDDWIAIDDTICADEDHMVWVNPDHGLNCEHLDKILERFGCAPCLILL